MHSRPHVVQQPAAHAHRLSTTQVQQQHSVLTRQDQEKAQVARWRNRCMRAALSPQPAEVRPAGESACSWASTACLRNWCREKCKPQARNPALQRQATGCKRAVYTTQPRLRCLRSHGGPPGPQSFAWLLAQNQRWSFTAGCHASFKCTERSWLWSRQLLLRCCLQLDLFMAAWQREHMCAGKHRACCGNATSCPLSM